MSRRPLGISILAILYILNLVSFVIIFASTVFVSGNLPTQVSKTNVLILIGMSFLYRLVSAAAGISLWKGMKNGWYLAFYFQTCAMINSIISLLDQFKQPQGDMGRLIAGLLGIMVSAGICRYFLDNHVLKYFDLQDIAGRKKIALIMKVLIAAILTLLLNNHIGSRMY